MISSRSLWHACIDYLGIELLKTVGERVDVRVHLVHAVPALLARRLLFLLLRWKLLLQSEQESNFNFLDCA